MRMIIVVLMNGVQGFNRIQNTFKGMQILARV
jgi:hypothetical protein